MSVQHLQSQDKDSVRIRAMFPILNAHSETRINIANNIISILRELGADIRVSAEGDGTMSFPTTNITCYKQGECNLDVKGSTGHIITQVTYDGYISGILINKMVREPTDVCELFAISRARSIPHELCGHRLCLGCYRRVEIAVSDMDAETSVDQLCTTCDSYLIAQLPQVCEKLFTVRQALVNLLCDDAIRVVLRSMYSRCR